MRIFRCSHAIYCALLLACASASFSAQHGGKVASRPLDPAAAPNVPVLDEAKALQLSQSVLNRPVGDFTLLDRSEKPVRLADYRGKPLLVSFIYTGCFEVCPTTTRNLQKAVPNLQRLKDELGRVGAGETAARAPAAADEEGRA